MGSPSMDHEAGYQQARLDLMRRDLFALINYRHKTLDWNQYKEAWVAGYEEYLLANAEAVTALGLAAPKPSNDATCGECGHAAGFHHLPCDATPECACRRVPAVVRSIAKRDAR